MCPASAEDKYYAIRPHVLYMFYMNILYVIGCKNIHTVLLK